MAKAATSLIGPKRRRLGLGALLLVALLAGAGALASFFGGGNEPVVPQGWRLATAAFGPIEATVDTAGIVEAARSAEVRFAQEGQIAAVQVQLGERVRAGQPVARINDADLALRLAQSRTDLEQARADLIQAQAIATPDQIAAAEARVQQARGQYVQARDRVTPADQAAAQAALERAQSRLARLEAGPAPAELARAEEGLQRAQDSLSQSRTDLSAAKERARLDIEARANALRTAQDTYSRVYWQNRELEKLPGPLPQANVDRETETRRAVDDAEAALEQARMAYEQARQTERITLQTREAELATAQAEHARVASGPLAEDRAEARAELQRAQAALAQLSGGNRQGELSALAAGIAAAQAELDRLSAAPATGPLLRAQAAVNRAELAVEQAELALERVTLVAPFDGTVVRIQMRVGESAGQNSFIAIADLSQLLAGVDVDEFDVARLRIGQPVRLRLDALPEIALEGRVAAIAPSATRGSNGSNAFRIEVTLDAPGAQVRPGMSVALRVVTERAEEVLVVPRQAVMHEGGMAYVLVPGQDAQSEPEALPYTRRTVEVGLSNDEFIAITAGLSAGQQVWVQSVSAEVFQ